MTRKNRSLAIGLVSTTLSLVGLVVLLTSCAHIAGKVRQPTPFEQVLTWDAQLAATNNSITKGVIALADEGTISKPQASAVLDVCYNVADQNKMLMNILQQGPDAAKLQADAILKLVTGIEQQIESPVLQQLVGVANPTTQQQITADVGLADLLVKQILSGLQQAGILH